MSDENEELALIYKLGPEKKDYCCLLKKSEPSSKQTIQNKTKSCLWHPNKVVHFLTYILHIECLFDKIYHYMWQEYP